MARRKTTRTKTKRRKRADVIKIAHTRAFELCEDGTCADFDPDKTGKDKDKKVHCPQGDGCKKGNCYCQLFRRDKGVDKDDPWLVAPLDHLRETKYEPKKWDYKCLCVRPILESTRTEDGVEYKVRYQLCSMGLCSGERTSGSGPDKLACTGDCGVKACKCTLFRLAQKDSSATWDLVAKTGKQVDVEANYYYRCFCLK
ncbi:MAG: hypothetical protein ACJ8M4_12295 [Chthoniobacterales bacterium]